MDQSVFYNNLYLSWPLPLKFGSEVPPEDLHALGISLPTWKDAIGWTKGDSEIMDKVNWGYPRSFTHPCLRILAASIIAPPRKGFRILLFSTPSAALKCRKFIERYSALRFDVRIRTLYPIGRTPGTKSKIKQTAIWFCVTTFECSNHAYFQARKFWERTGEGISSRQAQLCLKIVAKELGPVEFITIFQHDGRLFTPGRWQRALRVAQAVDNSPIRTRFFCEDKNIINLRISKLVGVPPTDVFLYPSGTKAIYDVYRAIRSLFDVRRTVAYGVSLDTFNTLALFGASEHLSLKWSEEGTKADLDILAKELKGGTKYLALFCEVPGGPFLRTPDLMRIRRLANEYGFVVVCDDTLGTSVNLDLLPYADIIVTSLGELFSGGCNVMGGTATINPRSKYHDWLHESLSQKFVDTYHPHDANVMALNSHKFKRRAEVASVNAERLVKYLRKVTGVKLKVYYPSINSTKRLYNDCRRPNGKYGNVVSIKFDVREDAVNFYDALKLAKGPMVGTDFSVAFAQEQKNKKGALEHLIRFSVGLETWQWGRRVIDKALTVTRRAAKQRNKIKEAGEWVIEHDMVMALARFGMETSITVD